MKIGIIGAGQIGSSYGQLWAEKDHHIFFGVRHPQSLPIKALLHTIGPNAQAGTIQEAAQFSDVIMLAVPSLSIKEVIVRVADYLPNKILIDVTNPENDNSRNHRLSLAEEIARLIPAAKVVKAFNTVAVEVVTKLKSNGQRAGTFVCADDAEARSVVAELGRQIGFEVVEMGGLCHAKLTESHAHLWIQLSRHHGRDIAFTLLRRG